MQRLAAEQRRVLGRRAAWHVGDIAWGLKQLQGREHESRFRIWEERGALVAWTWLKGASGALEHDVRAGRHDLLDEMLDEPDARVASAFEDDAETRAVLVRHGFERPGDALHFNVRDLSEPPDLLPLPDGFRYRTFEPRDLRERVSIHRAVWAPSRLTQASFTRVQAAWPYRASLDCAVEAPDGRFAAYCLVWPDDENAVGELEPVGVRSDFRRRGLGAAVCTFALRRLYEEGGREAIVYCETAPACALYRSIGFDLHSSLVGYERA